MHTGHWMGIDRSAAEVNAYYIMTKMGQFITWSDVQTILEDHLCDPRLKEFIKKFDEVINQKIHKYE